MNDRSCHQLRRVLRYTGLTEGVSFLLLLGVAMPLKYAAGRPEAVHVLGWAHGVLFMAYVGLAVVAWAFRAIGPWMTLACLVASVVPTGPFIVDGRLARADATASDNAAGDGGGGRDRNESPGPDPRLTDAPETG